MKKIAKIAKDKNITISFAESITGGYLSYSLTKIPGTSKIHKGSVVTYSRESKVRLLDVKEETIEKHTIVSKEVSEEMNDGLIKLFNSDLNVSVTGNAGPTYETNTNDLCFYYTISYKKIKKTYRYDFKQNKRIRNIKKASEIIEKKIIEIITD